MVAYLSLPCMPAKAQWDLKACCWPEQSHVVCLLCDDFVAHAVWHVNLTNQVAWAPCSSFWSFCLSSGNTMPACLAGGTLQNGWALSHAWAKHGIGTWQPCTEHQWRNEWVIVQLPLIDWEDGRRTRSSPDFGQVATRQHTAAARRLAPCPMGQTLDWHGDLYAGPRESSQLPDLTWHSWAARCGEGYLLPPALHCLSEPLLQDARASPCQ